MSTHDLLYQLQMEGLKRAINNEKLKQTRFKRQSEQEKTKQAELDVPEQRFKTQSKRHSLKIAELQVGLDAQSLAQKRIDAAAAPIQTRLHGQLTALQLGNAALDVAEARQLLQERRQLLIAQGFSLGLPGFADTAATDPLINSDWDESDEPDPIDVDWSDWTG
jgi:formate-dependent nitrite reductase cytochrome c552 subunit